MNYHSNTSSSRRCSILCPDRPDIGSDKGSDSSIRSFLGGRVAKAELQQLMARLEAKVELLEMVVVRGYHYRTKLYLEKKRIALPL